MKGVNLPNTTIISDNIANEIMELKQQDGEEIVIFGSPSVGHLLTQENLIDDYWFFVNPILLGAGIPLFKNIRHRIKLKLVTSNVFSSGVVCLHYEKI
jgi:dihydrofolate reductase